MSNSNINIQEINKNLQQSYIHYNPDRVDYTINNLELDLLESTGSSIWKDFFIASFALAVPTIINGYSSYNKMTEKIFTTEIFLNSLIGGVCLIVAIICFIVWRTNRKSLKNTINQIKEKPKYKLPNKN